VNDSGYIYAISSSSLETILRSKNHGDSWTLAINGLGYSSIRAIAANSSGDLFAAAHFNEGVFFSSNNGDSWQKICSSLVNIWIHDWAVNSTDYIYASASDSGVLRSADGGYSWERLGNGLLDSDVRWLEINSNDHIFAGTQNGGMFRSIDGGDTWMQINNGLPDTCITSLAINSSNHIYAGTLSNGLYFSTDNGDNWTKIDYGIFANNSVSALAFNISSDIIAGTSGAGIYKSANNGADWIDANYGLTSTSIHSMATNSGGDLFAGTARSGIYKSSDWGDSWSQFDTSLAREIVFDLTNNSYDDIFAGTMNGVYALSDTIGSWQHIGLSDTSVSSLAINSAGDIFAGTYYSGLYKQLHGDDNWQQVFYEEPENISTIAINTLDQIFIGCEWCPYIYRSDNNGDSWALISDPFPHTYFSVHALACNSSNDIFAGTDGGVYRLMKQSAILDDDLEDIPADYLVSQNYPNPFNQSTTIEYTLPVRSEVTIDVFNILGEKVKSLFYGILTSGRHSISWDGTNEKGKTAGTGIYFYRVKSGEYIQVRKMMLLK